MAQNKQQRKRQEDYERQYAGVDDSDRPHSGFQRMETTRVFMAKARRQPVQLLCSVVATAANFPFPPLLHRAVR